MQLRVCYYHFWTVFTQKIRVNSADGDPRANPLTERAEKAPLGVNMGAGVCTGHSLFVDSNMNMSGGLLS